jgi:hypothetical protein
MKTHRRVEVQLLSFLTSALDGGEWLDSSPGHFNPGERFHGTHCIGGWVDPTAGVEAVDKRKIPVPAGNRTPTLHPIGRYCTN